MLQTSIENIKNYLLIKNRYCKNVAINTKCSW